MFSFVFLVVLLSCFAGGSYGRIRRSPCYGANSTTDWTDMDIKPNKLTMFFTPSRPAGSPRRQVSDKGVASDAHYVLSDDAFGMRDVTERDDGMFSVLLDGFLTDVLKLEVRDCAQNLDVIYGDNFNLSVREGATTLDLVPEWYWDRPPLLLWNLSADPQAAAEPRRGRRLGRLWAMERLTQEHSGYYTFRQENRGLSYRRKITVHAALALFYKESGEVFTFTYEANGGGMDMSYSPPGGAQVLLMERGVMVTGWQRVFGGRMSTGTGLRHLKVSIRDVRPSDAGVFLLRDQRGGVAMRVTLSVSGSADDGGGSSGDIYINVGIAVAVLLLLLLCCGVLCVKKHRSKRSTKTSSVPLTAGTGALSFSDVDTTQPSTSAHPAPSSGGPTHRKQPGSTDLHPLVDASSSSSASHQPAASSDALSSTAGVQFELKGIPSAPPDCNVYTSDKLNFPSSSSSSSRPTELRSAVYQPLAPGPVESSPAPGLPVFTHPTTHF